MQLWPRHTGSIVMRVTAAVAATALFAVAAVAGPREQAKRMHDRIAGVPPSDAVLNAMEADIVAGQTQQAALLAMDDPAFYAVTLKNLVTPWTNRDQTVFVPLNDYTATVIGMVRDDVPFNELLSGDILYVGNAGLGLPAASATSNTHYEQMESLGINLMTGLQRTTQSSVYGIPAAATAGVMTSRAAAQSFFIAGTNRAMFRFTLLNQMCRELDETQDTSRPPDRIRQDVSRSPGGDARLFLNNCVGCHSGMDPMAQAFAYYTYDDTQGRLIYTAGSVQPKYSINADTFKYGFVTPDDSWENRWRGGQNALLGWDQALPGSGNGAKSLGQELGNSDAFAACQVEKVFRTVCLRSPVDTADRNQIGSMVSSFRASGYRLKQAFADAATYCMGQ
ncbi:MAG: hypothetical protein HW417_1934 [Steroidobacteraceae bacterium]|nr:hypothetical protein [Steroidobacteraceae bacterium]MBM2855006.1 hypothetical protein [Steroidobacteraceae bacterium]